MLQIRAKGTSARFYAPERDLVNCLPKLMSKAIGNCGGESDLAMKNLATKLAATFKLAHNPDLTIEDVLTAHKALKDELPTAVYSTFLHEFFMVVIDYHIAAMREVPTEMVDKDMDEALLLAFNNYINKLEKWPAWRRWLFKLTNKVKNLFIEQPDTLSNPVSGQDNRPPK